LSATPAHLDDAALHDVQLLVCWQPAALAQHHQVAVPAGKRKIPSLRMQLAYAHGEIVTL
jgi:hypothetical protein